MGQGNFGQALRRRREALGLNQHEMAAIIGVDATTISRYEKFSNAPSGSRTVPIEKLSRGYQGTPQEIRAGVVPYNFPFHTMNPLPATAADVGASLVENVHEDLETLAALSPAKLGVAAQVIRALREQAERGE